MSLDNSETNEYVFRYAPVLTVEAVSAEYARQKLIRQFRRGFEIDPEVDLECLGRLERDNDE